MKRQSFRGFMRRSFRTSFRERHPGEPMPLAPLRAISYASAGGAFSVLTNGQPLSAVMKIGFIGTESANVYSHKVVLMDETHNLVRTQTQYKNQLCRLRELLSGACDLVLLGFTGTPILSVPDEGWQLLNIIKGDQARTTEEGFISSFPTRPRPLFPMPLPQGIPDGILTAQRQRQLVHKVELHDETLNAYDRKRQQGVLGQRLRTYCNVCSFASSFHDGKSGNKTKILANPKGCCPKLLAVAEAVASSPLKALVMTGRSSGFTVMLEILRKVAEHSHPPFRVATMEDLSSFNHVSNLHGQEYRVLVADSVQCSEGVSFLAVRRALLTDVPELHSSFVQMCGRSIRMYGHRGLPEKDQQVVIQLYVASLPAWMKSGLGSWAFRAQRRHWTGKAAESGGKALLESLQGAGFKNLAQLKVAIDGLGISRSNVGDRPASASDKVRSFLARIGHAENIAEIDDCEESKSSRNNSSLIQAMRALSSSSSADDASLALSSSTADEDALEDLARQSRELAPALAGMRAWAVDKEIVEELSRPGARASSAPLWSNLGGDAGCIGDSNSIVEYDAEHAKARVTVVGRRLRGKTTMQAIALPAAPVTELVPLCDVPQSCEPAELAIVPAAVKQTGVRSLRAYVMESITKKQKVVETTRERIEVDTVVIKRVRTTLR